VTIERFHSIGISEEHPSFEHNSNFIAIDHHCVATGELQIVICVLVVFNQCSVSGLADPTSSALVGKKPRSRIAAFGVQDRR